MGTTEANFKKAKVTQVPMKCSIDVAYSHFSEVPVPMRDVRSWGRPEVVSGGANRRD